MIPTQDDPLRAQYERERALHAQYEQERAAHEANASAATSAAAPPKTKGAWNDVKSGLGGLIRLAGSVNSPGATMRTFVTDPEARGVALAATHGATFGLDDEVMGGVNALSNLVRGRSASEGYREGRDAIRGSEAEFAHTNPLSNFAAQTAGSVLTGKMIPGLNKLTPGAAETWTGRALNAGVQGAAAGAVGGAAGADGGWKGRGVAAIEGGIGGGVLGAGASAATDAVKALSRVAQGMRASRAVNANPLAPPVAAPISPTVASPPMAPPSRGSNDIGSDESGARRLLARLARQGKTVEDLATWDQTAQAPDLIAEGIGPSGQRALGTGHRVGLNPDPIANTLNERARDEIPGVRRVVTAELGAPVDDQAFLAGKRTEAQTAAKPKYDAAVHGVTITDPKIADYLERPDMANAYDQAARFAANEGQPIPSAKELRASIKASTVDGVEVPGSVPSLPAKSVQLWKLALDDKIARLEGQAGGSSTHELSQMTTLRDMVDNLLHEHAPGWAEAQATYARPMQEADAFRRGVSTGRTTRPADVPALLAGAHPEFTAQGSANTLHEDLGKLKDGLFGNVVNDPLPLIAGNADTRARLAVATLGDVAKQGRITDAAQGASRRLGTRTKVLGNSLTAERLADDAGASDALVNALQKGPIGGAKAFVGQKFDAARRAMTGAQVDAEGRLLLGGGPGQRSRQEVIELLRVLAPQFRKEGLRQSQNAGVAGGTLARYLAGQ